MRKQLLILLILSCSVFTYAQNKTNQKTEYCELTVKNGGFENNTVTKAFVNYGEKDVLIKDTAGHKMKFKSSVAAINYMTQQGWTLVTAYYHENTHFFFKREKE